MNKLREDLEAVVAMPKGTDRKWFCLKFVLDHAAEILAMVEDAETLAKLKLSIPDEIGLQICAPISQEWMAEKLGYRNGWNNCRNTMLASLDRARKGRS